MLRKMALYTAISVVSISMSGQGMAGQGPSKPVPEKAKEFTPSTEEQAKKMMLMEEHMKQMGAEHPDVKRKIGSTLHALSGGTFVCPTAQELDNGLTDEGTFEKDGIHFYSPKETKLPINRYGGAIITFKKDQIETIECHYNSGKATKGTIVYMTVDFKKSNIDPSQISVKQDIMSKKHDDKIILLPGKPGEKPPLAEFIVNPK